MPRSLNQELIYVWNVLLFTHHRLAAHLIADVRKKREMQTMFFATKEDLTPVIQRVEAKHSLKYVLSGLHYSPELTSFDSALDIPSLGIASHETAISGDNYLVADQHETIVAERKPQNAGGIRYAVDQLKNPRTIGFLHGGRFSEDVILYGRIATASDHLDSLALYRFFFSAIRKHFVKLQSFYVGTEAKRLCDSGFRLTQAVQSPKEYDLSY